MALPLRQLAAPHSSSGDWSWATPKSFAKDRNAAQNAQSGLIAERTAEYQRSFAPAANSLRDMALSTYDQADTDKAMASAGRTYDASAGALERQQRGLGVAPVAGQEKRLSLRRILSQVDSGNRAIDGADERRSLAQMYSTDQYGDLMSNAGSIYGDIASQELNRKGQYRQAQAGRDSSVMGAVGTVAGIAMAFM